MTINFTVLGALVAGNYSFLRFSSDKKNNLQWMGWNVHKTACMQRGQSAKLKNRTASHDRDSASCSTLPRMVSQAFLCTNRPAEYRYPGIPFIKKRCAQYDWHPHCSDSSSHLFGPHPKTSFNAVMTTNREQYFWNWLIFFLSPPVCLAT